MPKITKDEARRIAQKECEKRELSWGEPVVVHWGWTTYTVWAYADRRGGNTIVKIRKKDGEVMSAIQTPR